MLSAFIYVIGPETGAVKIGIATDVQKRRSALQTGHPQRLSVLYQLPVHSKDAQSIEAHAHWLMKDCRLSGEWFDISVVQAAQAIRRAAKEVASGEAQAERQAKALASKRTGSGLQQLLARRLISPIQHRAALGFLKGHSWAARAPRTATPKLERYIDARRWMELMLADVKARCGAEAIVLVKAVVWQGHRLHRDTMAGITDERAAKKLAEALDVMSEHLPRAPWSTP